VARLAEDASPGRGALGGELFATPRSILRFAGATLAWGCAFFALWFVASEPLSQAAGWVAARAMEVAGPVEKAAATPRDGQLVIAVLPDASLRYRDRLPSGAWFEIAMNSSKYTVGLPFFLALVAAAKPRRIARIAVGIAVIIALAGVGIACEAALSFATLARPGGPALFRPGVGAASALALGYQLGTLLVPTLVPIALWLWTRYAPAQVDGGGRRE